MTAVPAKDKIEFMVALVSDFAKKYSLSTTQACPNSPAKPKCP